MPTLSGCTVIRNGVTLRYPLEASLQTYLPICDEVVIAYDPTSTDATEQLVKGLAARYRSIRLVPSAWDLENRRGGSEIAVQSNVALEACRMDWTLYVQADEAIHEQDHAAIRQILGRHECLGACFERRSFWATLEQEIAEHRVQGLLRLFRTGLAYAVGDAMTCRPVQTASGRIEPSRLRLFNYSRMGPAGEVMERSRSLHGFYHPDNAAVAAKLAEEKEPAITAFRVEEHPSAIRERYGKSEEPHGPSRSGVASVTLAVLLGLGEREQFIAFLWQFRGWPGDIVIVDDAAQSDDAQAFAKAAVATLPLSLDRIRIIRHSTGKDFGAARNRAHAEAASRWMLHADLDERWDPAFVRELPAILNHLDRNGIVACGFPRANFLNGALVNDVPDSQWTEDALASLNAAQQCPPRNQDVQFRLLRREIPWIGPIHERPAAVQGSPDQVRVLQNLWILHDKSLARQRRQDQRYRSLGQTGGMAQDRKT